MALIISLESQYVLSDVPEESIKLPFIMGKVQCRHLIGLQSKNYVIFLYITSYLYATHHLSNLWRLDASTQTTDHIPFITDNKK